MVTPDPRCLPGWHACLNRDIHQLWNLKAPFTRFFQSFTCRERKGMVKTRPRTRFAVSLGNVIAPGSSESMFPFHRRPPHSLLSLLFLSCAIIWALALAITLPGDRVKAYRQAVISWSQIPAFNTRKPCCPAFSLFKEERARRNRWNLKKEAWTMLTKLSLSWSDLVRGQPVACDGKHCSWVCLHHALSLLSFFLFRSLTTGWRRWHKMLLTCISLFSRKPLIIRLFDNNWPFKKRHPQW